MHTRGDVWCACGFAAPVLAVVLAACSGGGGNVAENQGGGVDAPLALELGAPVEELVEGGASTEVVVEVEGTGAGAVVLEVTETPAGITATLSRASTTTGTNVTLAIDADPSLPVGTYTFRLRAVLGDETVELPISVQVMATAFDFTADAERRTSALRPGGQVRIPVSTTVTRGSLPPGGTWLVSDLPTGVAGSVAGGELVLTADALAAESAGSHDVTVSYRVEPLTRNVSLLLQVLPADVDAGVRLTAPTEVQVRSFGSTSAQVDVERVAGITGDVVLAVTGLPDGVTATFADNPATQATSRLLVSAAGAAEGESMLTVTATDEDGGTSSTALLLRVVPDGAVEDPRVQRIEFAQAFFGRDPGLVGGKETLVRAHVVCDLSGIESPTVRLEGRIGSTSLGTRTMTGPATLPTAETPSDLGQSFRTTLPAGWVQDGLQVVVTVDPEAAAQDRERRNNRAHAAPRIGSANAIDLVLVPLVVNGRTPVVGGNDVYEAAMLAHWPVSSIRVSTRAPYTVTSTTDVSSGGSGWSDVLFELRALKISDGSSAYYYGVLDTTYSSGVAGLGFVGYPASVGWDRSSSRVGVMLHELGHNFGLNHAPCGGPSGTDTNFPYAGARLGAWGYDRRNGSMFAPGSARDLMSYCGPEWVSDYNHELVRQRISANPYVFTALADAGGSTDDGPTGHDIDLMTVTGTVDGESARIDRILHHQGRAPTSWPRDAQRPLVLRVTQADGRILDYPAGPLATIGCGDDAAGASFAVTIPALSGIARIELWERGVLHAARNSGAAPGVLMARGASAPPTAAERTSWNGPELVVDWDAGLWPDARIAHVGTTPDGGTRRTTLTLAAHGGRTVLPLGGLPAGGAFEVTLTDGLDRATYVLPR